MKRRQAPLQSTAPWRVLASGRTPLHALALAHLQAWLVEQYSEQTVRGRAAILAQFVGWCGERDVRCPSEIGKALLERYQRHLYYYRKGDGQPLTIGRQLHVLRALQTWFRWLARNNRIAANPASDLVLPRKPLRQLRQPLGAQEVERVLASLDVSDALGLRDRAMFEVLYSTGIRRSELVALTLSDVDARGGCVFVRQGKGKKDRVIPIGERALRWLERYREEVREGWCIDPQEQALFVDPDGSAPSADAVSQRVRKVFDQLGIRQPGACHLFRHTMATEMLNHGADVRYVQEMLGHARLDTTQIYTHVSITKLKAVHAATHPGATLKSSGKVKPPNSDHEDQEAYNGGDESKPGDNDGRALR